MDGKVKSWRDIRDWARSNEFNHLANRMELNDRCWMSSGEFGRSQVAICDAIRFADSEEEAKEIAAELDLEMEHNHGLW